MSNHAELSGSGSYRWIRCPGSVRMTAEINVGGGGAPGTSSFAREGIFAHAVAAHILTTDKMPENGDEFTFTDHDEEIVGEITDEMLGHVMVYVDHVRRHGQRGVVRVEQHVDLSSFVRDNMFGTADAIIIKSDELVVVDFKYGHYPVLLINEDLLLDDSYGELGHINSQLLYYGAGAANAHGWHHRNVRLEIIQPRCMEVPDVQSVVVDGDKLEKWAREDLWRAAHLATSIDAPLSAGDWCRFCPALAICPEARKKVQDLAVLDFADWLEPQTIEVPDNTTRIVEVMHWTPIVDAWLRAVEAYALQLMQNGVKIAGFKLVEKRANRCWPSGMSDQEIFKQLKARGGTGANIKQFLTSPEFISPAKAEKVAGRDPVNAVCEHPRGELTVAADSDRRPAVDPTPDFEEFQ